MIKRALALVVVLIVLLSSTAASQTRKRKTSNRSAHVSTSFADKMAAEVQAGRTQIAAQIKVLTQFLYLLGGISKGIETAEQANRNHEETAVALPVDQIERNKTRVKDSIRNMRAGLDQLESSFRMNPALQTHYSKLAGVARIGQMAESQAAANNFDQAGRSLITAVNKLADALAALR